MSSNLKEGQVWTPPTYTDDGSQNASNSHVSAQKMNAMTAEIQAVQRYAMHGGANVANVRDYGASPSNTPEQNRVAIQAAADSGRKFVYIPEKYVVSDTIVVGTGDGVTGKVVVGPATGRNSGEWARLTWAGGNQKATPNKALLEVNCDFGGGVHGLGLDCGGANAPRHALLIRNGTTGAGWAEDAGVSNLLFWGAPYTNIKMVRASDYWVTDCIFDNNSVACVEAQNCLWLHITGNKFFNRTHYGVWVYGGGNYGCDHVIANNVFSLNGYMWPNGGPIEGHEPLMGHLRIDGAHSVAVTGNDFQQGAGGVIFNGASNSVVSGNTFHFHQMDTIQCIDATNVNVSGNQFSGGTSGPDGGDWYMHYALSTSGACRGIAFTNNNDYEHGSMGVLLRAGTTHSLVDNYLHSGWRPPSGGPKQVTNLGGPTNVVGRIIG